MGLGWIWLDLPGFWRIYWGFEDVYLGRFNVAELGFGFVLRFSFLRISRNSIVNIGDFHGISVGLFRNFLFCTPLEPELQAKRGGSGTPEILGWQATLLRPRTAALPPSPRLRRGKPIAAR